MVKMLKAMAFIAYAFVLLLIMLPLLAIVVIFSRINEYIKQE